MPKIIETPKGDDHTATDTRMLERLAEIAAEKAGIRGGDTIISMAGTKIENLYDPRRMITSGPGYIRIEDIPGAGSDLRVAAAHSAANGKVPRRCSLSAGSASLIAGLLRAARNARYFVALIDGRDSFDPCGLDNAWLQHLLWVRCSKASEAVKAADLLLRDGNFPLVIVDLVLNAPEELRKIPQTNWYRMQRLVEVLPTACLVLTRYEMVSSAQLKLLLENFWDIQTFETEDALSRLRIVMKRSHFRSVNHQLVMN